MEDWEAQVKDAELVFHERRGMSYEYTQVEIYRQSGGRYIERYESLHVDADEARVRWSWLEGGEGRVADLRAEAAARAAQGEGFFDLNAASRPGPASAATPAAAGSGAVGSGARLGPGSDPLAAALEALLQRSGGFVIATDSGSGRFVQFAGGLGEPLLLDVPNLSAEEGIRASQVFAAQPFSVAGSCFNLAFGEDTLAAASAARTFFREVLRVAPVSLSLETE